MVLSVLALVLLSVSEQFRPLADLPADFQLATATDEEERHRSTTSDGILRARFHGAVEDLAVGAVEDAGVLVGLG